MKTIRKLLVANRGEIASRIFRTARGMGIGTVAVFSDADADWPFVRDADEAVHIGPSPASESYLLIEKHIEAARRTGADAIHPGFGFLAENEHFAEAVAAAGLVFIGPSPRAIAAMGKKREAKALAASLGVPTIPGDPGDGQTLEVFRAAAQRIGYPVLLKASAGGGGKGMKVARSEEELEEAFTLARSEGQRAFGDPTLILERYIDRPRHIEIQILGDQHGQAIHLFERECSIQRRHQKIIEEAPSSFVTPELRAKMGDAAVRLARAIGYDNAGTVEFIVAPDGTFAFLEVNTRLQVEHPVTEGVIFGLDLVEEQIRIARGEPLRLTQGDVEARFSGAAIECRLCAEDPENDFLPVAGEVIDFALPETILAAPWFRLETAVEAGSHVSVHYDSMIAKLIVEAPDRATAIARMGLVLERLSVLGVTTNRGLLADVIASDAFARGDLDTGFLARDAATFTRPPNSTTLPVAAMVAMASSLEEMRRARHALGSIVSGFRNHRFRLESDRFREVRGLGATGGRELEIGYVEDAPRGDWRRYRMTVSEEGREATTHDVGLRRVAGEVLGEIAGDVAGEAVHEVEIEVDGHRRRVRLTSRDERFFVNIAGTSVALERSPRVREGAAAGGADGCVAPMPGKVLRVLVSDGQAVEEGDAVLVLEAMKMEHTLRAPHGGTVRDLRVAPGDQVEGGAVLLRVE